MTLFQRVDSCEDDVLQQVVSRITPVHDVHAAVLSAKRIECLTLHEVGDIVGLLYTAQLHHRAPRYCLIMGYVTRFQVVIETIITGEKTRSWKVFKNYRKLLCSLNILCNFLNYNIYAKNVTRTSNKISHNLEVFTPIRCN